MQETITTYNPLNDYRLILDPPMAVKRKIAAIKTEFDQDYKGIIIPGGQAFIYLAEFSARELKEQDIVDQLNRIALGFMPFKLHLSNFEQSEKSEIYIPLENDLPAQMLVNKLEATESLPEGGRINRLPRITIAKGLQPYQFVKSWKEYEKKVFQPLLWPTKCCY
ncbi:hypothetical protein [Niabella hibiscisoli]|uniref:hypothetical protein n=1 Tax=Niabella hibiscisoli TaxID=1825928 RepID=UPI001F0FC902|nr:hypothetical protein [Niabella hibiscisoli]MCH5716868.1 hypothetical protein [Niabella hibiscisoli]